MTSPFKAGKVAGYIIRSKKKGAALLIKRFHTWCSLKSIRELLDKEKGHIVTVGERNGKKEPVGYLALSRDRRYFFFKYFHSKTDKKDYLAFIGWRSRLVQFLKGKTKRCSLHRRLPRNPDRKREGGK